MHKTISERPWRGEVLHQIFSIEVRYLIRKWTQSDLKFCKNEGSIRSKTNEKRGQLDQTFRQKLMQNGEN